MNRPLPKKCFTLLFIVASFFGANAQEYTVKGALADSASSKPLADAMINFLQPQSKVSKTLVSDKNGFFQTTLPAGPYKVTITHSSYRKKNIHLAVESKAVDLGSVQLVALVKNLAEVTVIANRPMVEQKDDRLIYNVEDDPAAKSESASEILRKTPFVSVDGDGGIQVNGQSNFKVLLDGRETALFSQNVKEALKAFPGASIARIEVITSPSSKYDAEGIGGIINIITKKKVTGYNGSVNTHITNIGNKSGSLNISLKKGKLGVTGMFSIMSNPSLPSHQLGVTIPYQSPAFVRREVGGERVTEMSFQQGNIEFSYDIDSTNTLVFYGNRNRMHNQQINDYHTYTLFPDGSSHTSPYPLETRMTIPTYSIGSDFIRKYKGKPQKELTFRFLALFNENRSFNYSEQEIGGLDRYLMNNSEAFNKEYTAQADLVEPLNKTTRIETGIKAILRRASSDFESQVRFNKSDPYAIDPSNSNEFLYDQDVYGGYVSVNKVFKAFTARVGLRVEHTRVDGDFKSTSTVVQQRYTSFIPNVLLTKQISKSINTNLTYTMRLGRPSINSLNPFVNNSDSLVKSFGNPNLGPQYIHMFTWQVRFFKGAKFISLQAGHNFSNNLIIQNPSFDPATGITSITGANAGQIREYVLGFSSNLPLKKWNFSVNANARLARMRNNLQSDWDSHLAGNVNSNVSFKPSQRFTITSHGGYFVPMRTPNSTFPDNYFYGLSFGYKFFNQKLTITANATNFFEEERELKFHTENESFITRNTHTILFRTLGLSLTYNFGRLKENVSKKKGVSNDDEVN